MPKIVARRVDDENILLVESDAEGLCRVCDIKTGTATARLSTAMVLGSDAQEWAPTENDAELLARALACKAPREARPK